MKCWPWLFALLITSSNFEWLFFYFLGFWAVLYSYSCLFNWLITLSHQTETKKNHLKPNPNAAFYIPPHVIWKTTLTSLQTSLRSDRWSCFKKLTLLISSEWCYWRFKVTPTVTLWICWQLLLHVSLNPGLDWTRKRFSIIYVLFIFHNLL